MSVLGWTAVNVRGHRREGSGVGHRRPFRAVAGPSCLPRRALGEELFTDPARVLGGHHGVARGPLVREDLMVVPALWRHEADTAIAWGQGCRRKEEPAIGRAGRVSSVTSFLWKLRDSHAEKGVTFS